MYYINYIIQEWAKIGLQFFIWKIIQWIINNNTTINHFSCTYYCKSTFIHPVWHPSCWLWKSCCIVSSLWRGTHELVSETGSGLGRAASKKLRPSNQGLQRTQCSQQSCELRRQSFPSQTFRWNSALTDTLITAFQKTLTSAQSADSWLSNMVKW